MLRYFISLNVGNSVMLNFTSLSLFLFRARSERAFLERMSERARRRAQPHSPARVQGCGREEDKRRTRLGHRAQPHSPATELTELERGQETRPGHRAQPQS